MATITLRPVDQAEFPEFHKHVCPPRDPSGSPFDPLVPDRTVRRNLLTNIDWPLNDANGNQIARLVMWILEDKLDPNGKQFPSALIRTVQGEIVHGVTGGRGNTHTIHWHGIEPSSMNDGVGAQSFELSGGFTYQFATNEAGTYFYHCHKNTPLHFIRGLYGGFVVDPKKPAGIPDTEVPPPPYPLGGPGFTAAGPHPDLPAAVPNTDGNPVIKYDKEVVWVGGEMDSRWMKLGTNAFMQKCNRNNPIAADNFTQNGILNDFRPDIFHITGDARRKADSPVTFGNTPQSPLYTVNAGADQTVLIREITAGFKIHQYTLPVDVIVIAMDGHPLGTDSGFHKYNKPFKVPANTPFRLTSARRWDMIIPANSAPVGNHTAKVEFVDWVTDKVLFTGKIPINIT